VSCRQGALIPGASYPQVIHNLLLLAIDILIHNLMQLAI